MPRSPRRVRCRSSSTSRSPQRRMPPAPREDAVGVGQIALQPAATQQTLQPYGHLHHAERLGQVVVGAEAQTPDPVLHGVARGQEQHRQGLAAVPQQLEEVEAVDPRHHHVEHDRVGVVGAEQGESGLRVGCGGDPEPGERQRRLQHLPDAVVVVHHEHVGLTGWRHGDSVPLPGRGSKGHAGVVSQSSGCRSAFCQAQPDWVAGRGARRVRRRGGRAMSTFLYALGHAVARHRWRALIVWVLLAGVCFGVTSVAKGALVERLHDPRHRVPARHRHPGRAVPAGVRDDRPARLRVDAPGRSPTTRPRSRTRSRRSRRSSTSAASTTRSPPVPSARSRRTRSSPSRRSSSTCR